MSDNTAEGQPVPERTRIRMYQVGFGDCFLLTFEYAAPLQDGRSERQVLIDFGSTRRPKEGASLEDVARMIEGHSGGQLDAIAVSHRHKDHLSGFAIDEAAKVIDTLRPRIVLRPWTEDPGASPDATGSPELGERSRRFLEGLSAGENLAKTLAESIPSGRRGLLGGLRSFALDQLANREAIERLDGWAEQGQGRYLHYGSPSGIEEVVPGIRVRVLGPPTLEQWPDISRQRAEDPEFWMLHSRVFDQGDFSELARAAEGVERDGPSPGDLGPERWLIERMRRQELSSVLRVVRVLDDVLNNTSLILLFEVGIRRLLFPGDAQIENWSYALKGAPDSGEVLELLRRVDLYKVGHHGSRNATPRTLFGLWNEADTKHRPMAALMSTLSGVHGETEQTRVPRATLVKALQERMTLLSSEELADERFGEVEMDSATEDGVRWVNPALVVGPTGTGT